MSLSKSKNYPGTSIDPEEIRRFSRHAQDWWNPHGTMRPLHELNPVRLAYIRDSILIHHKISKIVSKPLHKLSILDVGCGAGLVCEPLARLGAQVQGIDASGEALDAARSHAALSGLSIKYSQSSAEEFVHNKKNYDVVMALEILEHVADTEAFIGSLAKLLKSDGLLILSTVNRTVKSFLLGIVMAEYLLQWVPKGTHDWRKFLRPSEVASKLERRGLYLSDITGIVFNPLSHTFSLSPHGLAINYMMSACKRPLI